MRSAHADTPGGGSLKSTLILGIGNTLLGDEGAGVHALERIRALLGDATDVDLLDGGTLVLHVAADARGLPATDRARRRAARTRRRARSTAFEGPAMDEFLGRPRRSVHEVGLCDLMDMARLSGCFPQQRALIGIQPEFVDWSETCSPPVAAALDEVARRAVDFVRRWDAADAERGSRHEHRTTPTTP